MAAHEATRPVAAAGPRTLVGVLLAFTAGFVDTVGFVALFGLFTAHVTGNFVLIGASLAQSRPGILVKLAALPTFVLLVVATRLWVRHHERRGRRTRTLVLAAQIVLLSGFLAVSLAASPVVDADAPWAIAAGLSGVAAMAVQNAAARLVFPDLAPTTVMTGNVTQVVIDLVDLLCGGASAAIHARFAKMWPPVVAFAVGACTGGLAVASIGFWCLLCPILALVVVAAAVRYD